MRAGLLEVMAEEVEVLCCPCGVLLLKDFSIGRDRKLGSPTWMAAERKSCAPECGAVGRGKVSARLRNDVGIILSALRVFRGNKARRNVAEDDFRFSAASDLFRCEGE